MHLRRFRPCLLALGILLLLGTPAWAAESEQLRLARAAAILDRAGVGEVAFDLLSLQTRIPAADLRALGRPVGETAPAAVLTALTGIELPLAGALLAEGGLGVTEVATRLGIDAREVRAALAAAALALEAGGVALGLDAKDMHGPGGGMGGGPGGGPGDETPEACEPGEGPEPGHGHHHDCDPGEGGPGDPGTGPGPGDDHHGQHQFDGEECEHQSGTAGPHGHGCAVEFAEEFEVEPFPCTPSALVACLSGGRFEVTVEWGDYQDAFGYGHRVELPSPESALFWFFEDDNYELLVKALDGCAVNGYFWVFAAATTDVEYALTAIDSQTGAGKTYFSPLHMRSRAVADVQAFPCQ